MYSAPVQETQRTVKQVHAEPIRNDSGCNRPNNYLAKRILLVSARQAGTRCGTEHRRALGHNSSTGGTAKRLLQEGAEKIQFHNSSCLLVTLDVPTSALKWSGFSTSCCGKRGQRYPPCFPGLCLNAGLPSAGQVGCSLAVLGVRCILGWWLIAAWYNEGLREERHQQTSMVANMGRWRGFPRIACTLRRTAAPRVASSGSASTTGSCSRCDLNTTDFKKVRDRLSHFRLPDAVVGRDERESLECGVVECGSKVGLSNKRLEPQHSDHYYLRSDTLYWRLRAAEGDKSSSVQLLGCSC